MEAILIKPRNIDEFAFVQEFLKRTKLKSEILQNEDIEDKKAYRRAVHLLAKGMDSFIPAEQVFATIEAKRATK